MHPKFFYWLQRALQRFLVNIPKLSEGRVAIQKTMAFLKAWHFISRTQVGGDYLEFGVFEGSSFDLSLRCASKFLSPSNAGAPRFFAFDSFEGLPMPDSERDVAVFKKGEYQAGQAKFLSTIASARRSWEIKITPGFYDKSLTSQLLSSHNLKKAAFINFDSDLYPSTLATLRFVTPLLQSGTVFFFDDWYSAHGDMSLGEAGACRDWLKENPHVSLIDYGDVGILSKMFIVNLHSDR